VSDPKAKHRNTLRNHCSLHGLLGIVTVNHYSFVNESANKKGAGPGNLSCTAGSFYTDQLLPMFKRISIPATQGNTRLGRIRLE
jgi:hypothetical protein